MKLSHDQAGYDPPFGIPFQCATCQFYLPNACKIVSGQIQPHGCCNLWTSKYNRPVWKWLSGIVSVRVIAFKRKP
jgi:hypothetical protein